MRFNRGRLARWLVPLTLVLAAATTNAAQAHPNHWAEVNGVSLRYQLTGSGSRTIVFLHPQTLTMEDWDDLYPAFQDGRKILRYDMRGWGLSEKIGDGAVTMDQAVDDLGALLDALEIRDKVVLVGSASGANVALVFAARHPERVKAVATFSASINLKAPSAPPLPATPAPEGRSQSPAPDRYGKVYPAELRTDARRWARFVAMNNAADPASSRAWATMTAGFDFTPVLPTIQAPTLIVGTSLFPGRTMTFMRQVAEAIPRGEFVEMKSAHFAEFQSPELAIPVLKAFLDRVGG